MSWSTTFAGTFIFSLDKPTSNVHHAQIQKTHLNKMLMMRERIALASGLYVVGQQDWHHLMGHTF